MQVLFILGALANRSAQKRKLGEISGSSLRKALEVCAIVIIIAAVLLQKNLTYNIATDPVPNLIIALWAIIAYMVIALKKQKAEKRSLTNLFGRWLIATADLNRSVCRKSHFSQICYQKSQMLTGREIAEIGLFPQTR